MCYEDCTRCVCGHRYKNNCAHFLSNWMIITGKMREKPPQSTYNCSRGRPARALDMRKIFTGNQTHLRNQFRVKDLILLSLVFLIFQIYLVSLKPIMLLVKIVLFIAKTLNMKATFIQEQSLNVFVELDQLMISICIMLNITFN